MSWNAPLNCNQTGSDTIQNYYIYRVDSCVNYIPSPCQTGVPTSGGYLHAGTTLPNVTTFTDTGLVPGKTYSYIVIARFADCSSSLASSTACVVTGIENSFFNENISFVPNPSNGFVNLKTTLLFKMDLYISITNTVGQVVFSKKENNPNKNEFKYDLSFLAKGVYFAFVSDSKNNRTTKKIIIE